MSELGYNLDEPVSFREGEGLKEIIPSQVVGEESMLASFIESESPSLSSYEELRNEYQRAGVSPVIEGLKTRAASDANQEAINAEIAKTADGTQSLEQTEAILAETPALSEDDITNFHRELARARLMRTQATSPEQKVLAEHKWQELVSAGKISPEMAISERIEHIVSDMDPSAASQLGGIFADMVPFTSTVQFKNAFQEVFPDEEVGFTNLPRGEMALEFRKRMMKLDPETRYRTAVNFMEAVLDDDGLVSGTEFQNIMILQEALDPNFFQEGLGGINWDRVIGNTISVLDMAFVGGMARSAMRLGKRMFKPGSTLSTLNTVDQEAAAGLAAQGIKKDLNDALGMTPAEITEHTVVPAPYRQNVELLPPDTVRQLERGDDLTNDLLERTQGNTLAFSDAEQQEALRSFRKEAAQVNNAGRYGSNYTAQRTDTGIQYTNTYGRVDSNGKTVPFNTAREAVEHAAANFPTASRITVQQRTATGILKDVPKGKTNFKQSRATGEFVYTIEDFKPYSQVESVSNKIFFPDDSVLKTGFAAKYFYDPASRFADWISKSFSQAGDLGRGVQHQINQIAEPFTKIPQRKQAAVVKLLKDYQKQPDKWDTAKLIQAADGDEDIIKGFLSYRQTDEALYQLENRNYRNDLLAQDAKHFVEGSFQGVGTRMSDSGVFNEITGAGKQGIDVWDPKKGAMIRMDASAAQKHFANGNSIYRLKEPMGPLNRQTNLVMSTNPAQIRALPAQVLNKIDGHIARYYNGAYFVRRAVTGTMNGRATQNFQVLGVAKNKAEANSMVQQYVRDGKMSADEARSAIVHDRSLTPEARSTIDLQDKVATGRMFYHTRAKTQLKGIDGLAEVSDPVEALIKNIDSTSKYVAEGELLGSMKTRWMNTYGSLVPSKSFPQSADELASVSFADDVTRKQAKELWDQIKTAESINTREGEMWRDSIMSLVDGFVGDTASTTLWGKTKTALTAPLRGLADHSINNVLRSFAFYHLIAANPFRQLYVQSQQFMFLAALNPVAAPKIALKDGPAVFLGFMAKDTNPTVYKNMKPLWSKALGMSTKEYDEFMEGFIRTGIPHSVDSHDYVANNLAKMSKNISSGTAGKVGRALWNIPMTPLSWAKKAGFDVGELSNLTNTFMLARHRFLKSTGKKQLKSRKDFETVAANARSMALDMTRTGAFRYQSGAFSALTQFLSIQHKAFLAMAPFGKFGNQNFTNAERLRIALGQVTLNGATGIGLYELYRKARDELGLDIPDQAEDYIVGGLYETAINAAIAGVTGEEEQDFNIAGNVAPFSGINTAGVMDVLMGHKPFVELMASTNVLNRYGDAARTIKAMWDYPELSDDKQITNMISSFASVTSGWNQYIRGRAAMRLGVHVTNKGSPTVQSTYTSAIMESTLGLNLRTVDEYYALMDQYSNEFANTEVPWDSEKEISQIADALYAQTVRITTLFNDELDLSEMGDDAFKLEQMQLHRMQEQLKTMWSIMSVYDPIDRDRIWQRVQHKASTDRVQGRRGLIDNILKQIQSGDISGHKAEFAINRLRNSGLYNPNTQEGQAIEFNITTLMENMSMQREHSERMYEQLGDIVNGKD